MGSRYTHAFSPIEIRGLEYKNRIHMAPTSPKFTDPKGFMTTEHIDYFRTIARGGVGTITLGNCTVDIEHFQDEPRQVALDNDHYIPGLTRLVDMFDQYNVVGQCEINHPGLDSNWNLNHLPGIGPSAQLMSNEVWRAAAAGREPVPGLEMDIKLIKEIQQKYIDAAVRCKRAGMNSCFIHGGHGNLISQFASPLYNHRTDEYGGSLENRARFGMEILEGIRKRCGNDFVIEMRVSADEMHPDGMHFEETKRWIMMMDGMFDIVNVSAGLHSDLNYFRFWSPNMFMGHNINVKYAAELKTILKSKVSAVAGIPNIEEAEKILSEGYADFVLMARALMADPQMPRKYAFDKPEEVRPCSRCGYCNKRVSTTKTVACGVNPKLGREADLINGELPKAMHKKKVVVVGGGPGGMQSALSLIERGHEVILLEKEDHLGGNLIAASAMSLKVDMKAFKDYIIKTTLASGADIRLGTEATPELIKELAPDALILAVGADPFIPNVKGIDLPHVNWCASAQLGKCRAGDNIVIIGGGSVGMEGGADLAKEGKKVTIIEMMKNLPGSVTAGLTQLKDMIYEANGDIITGTKLVEVKEDRVIVENIETGEVEEIPCDTVLIASGLRSRKETVNELRHVLPETEVYIIGDAKRPRMFGDAIRDGFNAALCI